MKQLIEVISMTDNMKLIFAMVRASINTKFKDKLPTIEEINKEAECLRMMTSAVYTITDDEFESLKVRLAENILHTMGEAVTLKGQDDNHQSWYFVHTNDGYYWNRYKKYLLERKQWGTEIIKKLNETTNDIMDDLGNFNDHERRFQRRGLLVGDVQSGKTATYTAICNKAADAGYKVIIVLAGMMENLRVQTQGRLDAEFVGVDSRYTLDKKASKEKRNTLVGVGTIPPRNPDKKIAYFTSVATDFKKSIVKSFGLSLRNYNGTALFVVKKNKSVLNNLCEWLIENNADVKSGLIDLPLLLIDDEADNASINTNSEDNDPTAINAAIRNILNAFKQASYLGITATPFANIFIDPDSDTTYRDLFPKDFITVLPTPTLYIGADRIFGCGDADEWDKKKRDKGEFSDSLIPIENKEQIPFFVFKHKKDLAERLEDLPASMLKAIRYFILATAITDFRKDTKEHRSMLVNVSRFTKVQEKTAKIIKEYVCQIQSDLENYAQLPTEQALKIESIFSLKNTWDEYNLTVIANIDWETLLKRYLFNSARRIEVRSVNQKNGAASLDYYSYKDIGMRVIAVGGNSLSRGITLEGLCVSYFYRNTMMYDTLLQMGRWFGYRPNYGDIFKIWMAEEAIDWYGYITDAVNELKIEFERMKDQHLTPNDFGLKVRQAPCSLLVTAKNKMRTGKSFARPITVAGRLLETARLRADKDTIDANELLCRNFLQQISTNPEIDEVKLDSYTKAYVWKNVPKDIIANLVKNFVTHPWNLNFQSFALSEYILDKMDSKAWDVAIPQGEDKGEYVDVDLKNQHIDIIPEGRSMPHSPSVLNMLRVSDHHVRVGQGGCTKVGLSENEIKDIRKNAQGTITDVTYLVKGRNPLLLIHILKNTTPIEMREDGDPEIAFALGLGFPCEDEKETKKAKYVVNVRELSNWVDVEDEGDDDVIA